MKAKRVGIQTRRNRAVAQSDGAGLEKRTVREWAARCGGKPAAGTQDAKHFTLPRPAETGYNSPPGLEAKAEHWPRDASLLRRWTPQSRSLPAWTFAHLAFEQKVTHESSTL